MTERGDREWRVLGMPLEAAILISLVFTLLVVRRCSELDERARELCAGHPCAEGLEPVLIEDKCICMERVE